MAIAFWRSRKEIRKEEAERSTAKQPARERISRKPTTLENTEKESEVAAVVRDAAVFSEYRVIDVAGLRDLQEHAAFLNGHNGNVLVLSEEVLDKPVRYAITGALTKKGIQFTQKIATSEVVKILWNSISRKGDAYVEDGKTSLEELADQIIEDALARGASDIHLEFRESLAEVFFRIYGHRVRVMTLTAEAAFGLAGLLFDVRADHAAKRDVKWSADTPMDAVIHHERPNGQRVQIRFASGPIYPQGGFQMVCRLLLMDPKTAPSFENLGYTNLQRTIIEEMLFGAQGLVLLVGPTNSGKSTTMQAMAQKILQLRGATIKLESIEDPVEYIVPGACQMPVSLRADFTSLLKSTLRHDPDVLMVGEIRDAESAEAIKNIVLAGRKVLATLHAYEAIAAWSRLEQIGVPRDVLLMPGFISGIIYQRLLPELCQYCAIPYDQAVSKGMLPASLVDRVDRTLMLSESDVRVHNPEGCSQCGHQVPGYTGRIICAELVRPDSIMLDMLREDRIHDARQHWLQNSESDTGFGPTAIGHAMMLLRQGLVDPRDVEAQVGLIRDDSNVEQGLRPVRELPGIMSSCDGIVDGLEDLYAHQA